MSIIRTKLIFGLLLMSLSLTGYTQTINRVIIDKSANGKGLVNYLKEVENKYGLDFIYDTSQLEPLSINGITEEKYLLDYIDNSVFNLSAIKLNDNMAVIVDKKTSYEFGKKRDNYIVLKPSGKSKSILKGNVWDGTTDEKLIGVQVVIQSKQLGALTDEKGNYELSVPESLFRLDIRYVGYETVSYIVGFSKLSNRTDISVGMRPSLSQLETVVVTASKAEDNVKNNLTGVENLSISTIKELPTFMGEVDPLKGLITLPGVSTVGEVSSGINVRGGDTGQNLIIQDGAIIYNPTHLFGFFSAFNPDMISNVTLYKGGGDASYGGRVSSVMEVNLKNGNATLHTFSGGIGMVSSRISAEGPIVRDRVSYNFGGRVSYTNWLLKATNNIDLVDNSAKFYDLTGKIFYEINKNNSVALTGYNSNDEFKLDNDSTFSWSTTNLSLKWDHVFKSGMASTMTISNSNYGSNVDNENLLSGFKYSNGIKNLMTKYVVTNEFNEKFNTAAGIEANYNLSDPGKLVPNEESVNVDAVDINNQKSLEAAVFISTDFEINDKLSFTAGIRQSNFFRLGEDKIYKFDYDNLDGRYPSIVDSTVYKSNEVITSYRGLEPRVSLRYLLNDLTSIKASYYRGYQYLHLVSNTTASAPLDYWISSGPYIEPEIGDQVSLGYFKNMYNNTYEISVEGFYKNVKNTIDYIEGANTTLNKSLESGMIQGNGIAYGVEVMVKKNTGNLNGWLSYTYARSLRKFDSPLEIRTINNGEYYASLNDQPHSLSFVINYNFNQQVTLSSNFTYSTGRPITIPISKFSYDAYLSVLNYSKRNEYRIPDYHRLDVSLTIKDRIKSNKRFYGEWVFSVYNLYGRKNAFSIYFDSYGNAHKVAILGTFFPSLSYNFKF